MFLFPLHFDSTVSWQYLQMTFEAMAHITLGLSIFLFVYLSTGEWRGLVEEAVGAGQQHPHCTWTVWYVPPRVKCKVWTCIAWTTPDNGDSLFCFSRMPPSCLIWPGVCFSLTFCFQNTFSKKKEKKEKCEGIKNSDIKLKGFCGWPKRGIHILGNTQKDLFFFWTKNHER